MFKKTILFLTLISCLGLTQNTKCADLNHGLQYNVKVCNSIGVLRAVLMGADASSAIDDALSLTDEDIVRVLLRAGALPKIREIIIRSDTAKCPYI